MAAKEIKGLIKDSDGQGGSGVGAGQSVRERRWTEIVSSVKRVTDIIAEIAAASQEQTHAGSIR